MKDFDIADFLKTDQECAEYIFSAFKESIEESDPNIFFMAINDVARARNMHALNIHLGSTSHHTAPTS